MKTICLSGMLLPALLLLLRPVSLPGQTILTGTIVDGNHDPLPFASVLLLSAVDSGLVKGTVSAEDGAFQLDGLTPGTYLLGAAMLGYQTRHSESFTLGGDTDKLDLAPLMLPEAVTDLAAVEVTAQKPLFQQETDRMVVNVQNSVTAAGNTALDILAKSPGVVVNQQTNTLGMNGKEGVVVMINGKRSRLPLPAVLQMLAGMNASNIEKIELIANPPASFDAEGNAGVINIVLRESNLEGVNGSLSLNAGQGDGEKWGGAFNFNYRNRKFNLFGDYSFQYDHSRQKFVNYRQVEKESSLLTTESTNDRDPVTINHSARLGFDLQLTDRTVLGGLLAGYDNKWDLETVNSFLVKEDGTPVTELGIRAFEINHWRHAMGNLNLQHTLAGGQVFNVDLDYLYYHDDNPSQYFVESAGVQEAPLPWEKSRVSKKTPINVWVGKADYRARIGERINWNAGIKGTLSRFFNKVDLETFTDETWVSDPQFSQDYNLREDIAAAYTSVDVLLSERTNLGLGLRFEHTVSNLSSEGAKDIVDRRYGNFFPNVSLAHQLNEFQQLQFAYSRRITRPTFNDLAPFVYFIDPFTFLSGNTGLQPTLTNQVRLGYNFKNYSIALQYSRDRDAIALFQPTVDPETNQQLQSARNLDRLHTVALTVSLPFYVADWWEMQNTILGIWRRIDADYEGFPLVQDQQNLQLNTVQTFRLPGDYTLEISAFFQSRPLLLGILELEPIGAVNIGIQKTFGPSKSTLSLNVNDLFNTNKWKFAVDEPGLGLLINTQVLFETRVVRLTFTQPFGKQQLKGARQRSTGSDAERRRVQ